MVFFGLLYILAILLFGIFLILLGKFDHDLCKFVFFYQGDENDPELPYRDIAKFNIVQVAGALNTFYLDIRLS